MAVQVLENNSGPFGGWGDAVSVLGMATGQPWLMAAGMGMNAANSVATGGKNGGNTGSLLGSGKLDEVIDKLKGWINPAGGNIAKAGAMSSSEYDALKNKWGSIGDYGQF